ncbi:NTF2-like N-terminal transpeptidase domain-containing protein [Streptosporangium subroseum]|uniref:NTF2-like N-terminal transpeptidase domain-containing protein n=1 Tax=Streptosporangium subroseum TaxID=106412 RepID=A0A239NQP6_9ACTN|nr:penicillin-binding transpeptidase domain-containing protein [Streptosporangium subroseum]SNT56793.1 NTF2-like N-terminal transpeptidase domain-containing protein [Streptosporangium subroseum]
MKRKHLAVVAVLVPVAAVGAGMWALHTPGSAEETARDFLAAWTRQDYPAMRALTVEPPGDFDRWYTRFRTDLKLSKAGFEVTGSTDSEVAFHATLDGPVNWSYDGSLTLVEHDRAWRVKWSPAAVHPRLKPGMRIKTVLVKAEQAPILAADGTRIDTADAPGSVQQLVEGLKERYGSHLTGTSSARVDLLQGTERVATLATGGAKAGKELRTTIDLRVHRAAAAALDAVDKPTSLVALRPSTGEILAVVNKPGGFNRALLGHYPPGSTFKVVTASALVAGGMTAGESVPCPAEQNIGGFAFHNAGFEDYGTIPLREAFAHSCNTTFGKLSVDRLGGRRLASVATGFGFGGPVDPGVPAVRAQFPDTEDDTDLASASIGQGRVLTSPLNMATVAAAIADGSWRPPRLVDAALLPAAQPRKLEPAVVRALRTLMPAVVVEGTASEVAFPSGTAGKTGTAEFGSGEKPPSHAWFIGYRGDLAFSVIVEGGGAGAKAAAPIASRFLTALAKP